MTIVCKNCRNHFKGQFCNHCGQAANTHDINMHYLWHEIQHGVLHFDSGIVFTTKQLFTRPGHAIRDFIDGKRVQYFKPLAFLFVLSSIYILLTHYFHIENTFSSVELTSDDLRELKNQKLINNVAAVNSWIGKHYAYYMLLILPVTSLSSYLAFRRKSGNYLKHLILNAYITGQSALISMLFIPLLVMAGDNTTNVIANVETLVRTSFLTWAYVQFFDNNRVFKNILLTILAYFYFWLMVIIIAFVFVTILKVV